MAELKIDPGKMPDWGRADLPAPPSFTGKNIWAMIGPGIIGLSLGIGAGEWLMGPAVSVEYGPAVLWITTVAVFFQVIFNQECARYVMYTGETAFSGFMRTSPGPRVWGWVYVILGALGAGWPGWGPPPLRGSLQLPWEDFPAPGIQEPCWPGDTSPLP